MHTVGLVVHPQFQALGLAVTTVFEYANILAGQEPSYAEATPPAAWLLDYLRRAAGDAKRITSMCTGAFVLARAGLLDGRRATTHWQYTAPFRAEFPRVRVEEHELFVVDGPLWTSAGTSAGIDLALALVEADLGVDRAREIAKKLVVYNRRSGAQPQQSALLSRDARSDRVQTVLAFAREHLTEDLSTDVLAET